MNPTSRPTDREIREALLRRAPASPSLDLIDRIQQEIRTVKQNRPLIVLPGLGGGATTARLAWAAVLAALLVALVGVLAYIGSPRSNDLVVVPTAPSPSSTPTAGAEPPSVSASPSATPSEPLERGVATVLVDSLSVQSEPGAGEDVLTPALDAGQSVFVVDSGIEIDGVAWYAVAPGSPDGTLDTSLPKGWVASKDRDGQPLLSAIDVAPCPEARPTIEVLLALPDPASCFGNTELTVLASPAVVDVLGGVCFPVEDYPTCAFEPEWLVAPTYAVHPTGGWAGSRPIAWLAAAPGARLAEWDGSEVTFELTGHFADPAAVACRIYDTETGQPLIKPADQVIADCERTFVVTRAVPATQ